MMDFELKLEKPSTSAACLEGIVMGLSYFLGECFVAGRKLTIAGMTPLLMSE
jgi:hypothetical protein